MEASLMDDKPSTLIPFLIFSAIPFLLFIITLMKKRSQLGQTWGGPVSAQVTIKDKILVCNHCGNDQFSKREGLLVTSWIVFFFRTQYWNRSARCFQCKNCGCVHWFVINKEQAKFHRDSRD